MSLISSALFCRVFYLPWYVHFPPLLQPSCETRALSKITRLTDSIHAQLILAVYYTLADIVLLLQCFYYRGLTWRDEPTPPKPSSDSPTLDATHLSPATPLLPKGPPPKATLLKQILLNASAVLVVCLAGFLGWYLSSTSQAGTHTHHHHHHSHSHHSLPDHTEPLELNVLGQTFGYLCAALYLASRLPQILLNHRRKSTEGISLLFFLFACIGNLTYVLSIFAYEPQCVKRGCASGQAGQEYRRWLLVNTSWLIGSMGTLVLDGAIFAQFFMYRVRKGEEAGERDGERSGDDRPLLQRGDSDFAR